MNITLYVKPSHIEKYKQAKRHISPSMLFQYALDAYSKGLSIEDAIDEIRSKRERALMRKLDKIRRITKVEKQK